MTDRNDRGDTAYILGWAKKGYDLRHGSGGKFSSKKEQERFIKMLEGFLKEDKS